LISWRLKEEARGALCDDELVFSKDFTNDEELIPFEEELLALEELWEDEQAVSDNEVKIAIDKINILFI
jgi:hypothetical protein